MNPPIRLVFPALLLLAAILTPSAVAQDSPTPPPPVLVVESGTPSIQAQSGPPRTALIIGVGDYDGATYKGRKIQDLPGITTADLPKMEAKLESLGFAVTVVADPSLSEAKTAVDTFAARIKTNPGVSLFYFSGHGGEHEGKNYLIPSGASIGTVADLADEALSAQRVLNGMEASGATVNLVFLDCCREDLGKSVGGAEMAPLKARGSFIGFATRSGDFADPEEEGSPYTRFLLKHLGTPGLSVPDMYGFVAQDVKDYSKRVLGEERTPGYYSELAGAPFYLVPGGTVEPDPSGTPPGNAAEMAALLARLEAAEKAREEAERRAAMAATVTVPAAPMALTTPVTAPGFPASRGIVKGQGFRSAVETDFVWVESGTFTMGSSAAERAAICTPEAGGKPENYVDEAAHSVTISQGYWVGAHEVTIRDYLKFLNESGKWDATWVDLENTDFSPIEKTGSSYRMRSGKGATWGDESLPMVMVSWDGAVAYCKWLSEQEKSRLPAGYRFALPSEAEWEKAARGGTTTMTYAGDLKILGLHNAPLLDNIAWYGGNSGLDHSSGFDSSTWEGKQYAHKSAGTHPVGLKSPNEFGAHDMIGNVFEWCGDWYDEDYYKDGQTDPTGATSGSGRVVRGGGWYGGARFCRAANRDGSAPSGRDYVLGFRPALSSLPAR